MNYKKTFLMVMVLLVLNGYSSISSLKKSSQRDSTCLADTVGLSFNGYTSYVSLDSSTVLTDLALGDFSIELWVRTVDAGRSILIGNYDGNPSYNIEINTNGRLRVYLSGEDHHADIGLSDGLWHHIAVTVANGTEVKMYKDGLQVYSQSSSFSVANVPRVLQVGKDNRLDSHFFMGLMDEIRIWNVVLDSDVIVNYRCSSILNDHPYKSNLISHFPLNENQGDSIVNQGLIKGKGTIHGASWVSTKIVDDSNGGSGRYEGRKNNWWKGNTHSHPTSGAGLNPTAQFYHDNDYDFLVLTEHNTWYSNDVINISPRRKSYVIVAGEEFNTSGTYASKHISVLNSTTQIGVVQGSLNSIPEFYDYVWGMVQAKGGMPILNHPTWSSPKTTPDDLIATDNHRLFEMHNGNQQQDVYGIYKGWQPMEEIWDIILTAGQKWYGVAADDFHEFAPGSSLNPLTAWTMVKTSELTVPNILNAYHTGSFYSTNGVVLEDLTTDFGLYKITIDSISTMTELERRDVLQYCNPARPVTSGTPGFRIDFIGINGNILHTANGLSAEYQVKPGDPFVRGKVTYLRDIPENGAPYLNNLGQMDYVTANNITKEEYYAWGQPFFTDVRHEDGIAKFGCTDSSYLEYDATANILEPLACQTTGIAIKNINSLSDGTVGGLKIEVDNSFGDYSIEIRTISGVLVESVIRNSDRVHVIDNLTPFKNYIVGIKGVEKKLFKKIQIR